MRNRALTQFFSLIFFLSISIIVGAGCTGKNQGKKVDETALSEEERKKAAEDEKAKLEAEAQKLREKADAAKKLADDATDPLEKAEAEKLAKETETAAKDALKKLDEEAKKAAIAKAEAERVAAAKEQAQKVEAEKAAAEQRTAKAETERLVAVEKAAEEQKKKDEQAKARAAKFQYFQVSFEPRLDEARMGIDYEVSAIGRNRAGTNLYVGGPSIPGEYMEIKFENGQPAGGYKRSMSFRFQEIGQSSLKEPIKKILPTANGGMIFWAGHKAPDQEGIFYVDHEGYDWKGWLNLKSNLSGGVWNNAAISAVAVMGNTWFMFQNDHTSTGFHFVVTNPAAAASAGPAINGQGLGMIITAAVGGTDGTTLYMANEKGEVLVSTGNPTIDFSNRVTLVRPASLVIEDGVDNKNIGSLAVVGEKMLVGLRRVKQTQTGGVAIIDLKGDDNVKPTKAIDVRNIDAGADDKTALISSGKGLIFFDGDKLITIPLNASSEIDKVKTDSPWLFVNKPANLNLGKSIGAAQIGNTWYLGTDTGVYPMTIEEKTKN